MIKVIFFIDGFNLYHSLKDSPHLTKYKWLDLYKLCKHFTNSLEQIEGIFYFTALAFWDKSKVVRQRNFNEALEDTGIKIVLGKFKKKNKRCRICHANYETYEEKQTDVNIAINLFNLAVEDKFEKAYILSGDSDLIPAIELIKIKFPKKEIIAVFPIGRKSEELKYICHNYIRIKEKHLAMSIFPDPIVLKSNKILNCPSTWK